MSAARGDEVLRGLEREVEASGSAGARIKLAAELERRGRAREACATLLEAAKLFPSDADVRRAVGRYRGPAPGPWGAVKADARNTRLSPARGPRGEGRILSRQPFSAFDGPRQLPAPPPLIGAGPPRPLVSIGSRAILGVMADGHLIEQTGGAGGFEFLAERDGERAWSFFFEHPPDTHDESGFSRAPHAVIGPDGTVFGAVRLGKLLAVEPWGDKRWEIDVTSRVESLALDAERKRLWVAYEHPPRLVALDPGTGAQLSETNLSEIIVPAEALVLNDGRVACVSPAGGWVAVVSPDGALERTFRCADRIWIITSALSPWGHLIVVSSDLKGSTVQLFDAATGQRTGMFEAPDCYGVPAVDREGTLYLDGGARGYVLGFDLVSGAMRYKLDRAETLWQQPDRPGSSIAIGEGEVVFMDFAQEGVLLVRGGSSST